MASWQPPIPSGALYSKPARQLGPALALLAYCYDIVQKGGWFDLNLNTAAADMDEPYPTIKRWWQSLSEGPFFAEVEKHGRKGMRIRFKDGWVDWRILQARPDQTFSPEIGSEVIPNNTDEGAKDTADRVSGRIRDGNGTTTASEVIPNTSAYKEDIHDHKTGDVATSRKRSARPSKEDATPEVIRTAMADVCGLDLKVCSREQKLNLYSTAKRLFITEQQSGKTADETADTIRYVARWYEKNDWRGKKGDRPTPKALVDVWGAAITARKPATNGHTPPIDKPDQAASIKALGEAARRQLGWKD